MEKQQEFLDDLDEDLNVAKAMSLSLKRGPDPATAKSAKGAVAKRRDNSAAGRAEALEKSDILACSEAQSFIQQRAVALGKMDEEHLASVLAKSKGKTAVGVRAKSAHSPGSATSPPPPPLPPPPLLRLWDMGALPDATGREYCEIFENYKVRKD
ncbi:hypothetical protein IWW38_003952 [Coemansia aciculifera]|uniref:Uncharacterized protein n=1 Tax=Coemansia aciculifera TaxID=417176 RepID=A0ACC1M0W2_9FUNG|nr:hypothetical protein IWW38_003952 [Coemansia aciculifera]